jgi:hypothetical protein
MQQKAIISAKEQVMAKVTAGELITLNIENQEVTIKVEDASKSDFISGKVESSSSENYKEGNVYEFDRSLLTEK